jgi:hypothetical protein
VRHQDMPREVVAAEIDRIAAPFAYITAEYIAFVNAAAPAPVPVAASGSGSQWNAFSVTFERAASRMQPGRVAGYAVNATFVLEREPMPSLHRLHRIALILLIALLLQIALLFLMSVPPRVAATSCYIL